MMPLDPTVVIVFGTLFLSLVLSLLYAFSRQVLKYKASKRGTDQALAQSIRVSELEDLIRKATAEATLPLEARVADLEAELQSLQAALDRDHREQVSMPAEGPLLEVPDDEAKHPVERNQSRRRVR